MDEYTDRRNHHIDDFRADSIQFNELLILLDPCHLVHLRQLDIEIKVYSVSPSNLAPNRLNHIT